jgi:lysophospholipase L1-like esterase
MTEPIRTNKIGLEIKKRLESIDSQQAQINELVVNGDSSPQAAQASVGADNTDYGGNLKARLDAEYNKTNQKIDDNQADTAAQLAEKANQTYVDQVLAIVSNGGPDEIFYSIDALNSAYPNGANRTKLVFDSSFTDGAHSMLWNGSAWSNVGVYQANGIADGSVGSIKTDFLTPGTNLLNLQTMTDGYFVSGTTGQIQANASYSASDYIPVTAGQIYSAPSSASSLGKAFFDANHNFISGNTLLAPTGAYFLRITIPLSEKKQSMVIAGTQYPTTFISYGQSTLQNKVLIQKESLPSGQFVKKENAEFISVQKSINLFDQNDTDVTDNSYINYSDGTVVTGSSNFVSTGFIPVTSGTYSTNLSGATNYAFYDSSKTFISGGDRNTAISPPNAAFVRWTIDKNQSSIASFMVVEGSPYTGDYSPYYPKTYTLDQTVKISPESGIGIVSSVVTNLFNKDDSDVTDNSYIKSNDGSVSTGSNNFASTGYVPVTAGKTYSTNLIGLTNYAFYDSSKTFISGGNGNSAVAPANAAYIRWTIDKNQASIVFFMVVNGSPYIGDYAPYASPLTVYNLDPSIFVYLRRRWWGKLWDALGDSITFGLLTTKTYHDYAEALMGCTVNNYGISSTEICTGGTYPNPFISRYTSMAPADLITVFGGVNDYLHGAELGDFSSRDNATFYGALHNLCDGLQTNFTKSTIAFFTPLRTNNGELGSCDNLNSKGYKLEQYANAIKEVCAYHSVPVLDLFTMSGINPDNAAIKSKYTADGLHPNELGHYKLSSLIASFLESL